MNRNNEVKRYKKGKYYLPNGIIVSYNVIINGKNSYGQATDSDIKRYEEIRNITTGQGGDYTTGCLLGYVYVKNHYRLIVVDLGRIKKLDAHPKAIQQIEYVGQLKKADDECNAVNSAGT